MISRFIRFFVALALACISVGTWSAPGKNSSPSADNIMVIKYHDSMNSDYHHAYHFALIQRILEITRPEFGDYKKEPYGQAPNAKRQALLLSAGNLLNVHWAPPGTDIALAEVIPIPIDILHGLQGYRVCMINAQASVDFSAINNLESVKKLRIAQGSSWAELPIYQFNGINPIEPPILSGLYPMLGLKRFDCIPFGVNEISTLLSVERVQYPFLAIEPSLMIVYDFPIYFYVSKKFPKIAARFKLGIEKLTANGEFDKLFKQYHEQHLAQLNIKNRRVICLKSPFTDIKNQCQEPFVLPDFFK